jgi:hypothetical protein
MQNFHDNKKCMSETKGGDSNGSSIKGFRDTQSDRHERQRILRTSSRDTGISHLCMLTVLSLSRKEPLHLSIGHVEAWEKEVDDGYNRFCYSRLSITL